MSPALAGRFLPTGHQGSPSWLPSLNVPVSHSHGSKYQSFITFYGRVICGTDSAMLHPSFHCGHLHHFYFLSFMKNVALTFAHKFFFGHKILLLLHIYSWLLKTPVWTMRFHLHMVFSPINTYYSTMWYEVGWVHGCGTMDACGPMDYSLPDFSVHGILQARLLEWVAISSSREFFLTQGLSLCLLQLLCCG